MITASRDIFSIIIIVFGIVTQSYCFTATSRLLFSSGSSVRHSFFLSKKMVSISSTTASSSIVQESSGNRFYVGPSTVVPYEPPEWTKGILTKPPTNGRLHLANLPTPLYQFDYKNQRRYRRPKSAQQGDEQQSEVSTQIEQQSLWELLEENNTKLYIKRDDATGGVEFGGNKIRKLEFLLADAVVGGHDAVVTIGGEQSNHCRATAAASRLVGLQPHLILRRSKKTPTNNGNDNTNDNTNDNNVDDIGFIGNVLVDRMVGSTIYTCTIGEYGRFGSKEILQRVCNHLQQAENLRPYPIPVGGSNGLGTWGYINAVDELVHQCSNFHGTLSLLSFEQSLVFDHIAFASGSGGTAAGIALGIALAYRSTQTSAPKVHGIGVCDDENYFYQEISTIADEIGFQHPDNDPEATPLSSTEEYIRKIITIHQGKGLGYAISTPEELQFIQNFAYDTGIVLDPVYTGKALYNFIQYIKSNIDEFRNKNILFWHTGGALGLFDKVLELQDNNLQHQSPCYRLDVYGKDVPGKTIDISVPSRPK